VLENVFLSFTAGCTALIGKSRVICFHNLKCNFPFKSNALNQVHKVEEGANRNFTCFTDSHLLCRKHHFNYITTASKDAT